MIGTNRVNALDGGELVIDGTLTVGDNGSFGIGTGEASAGTVTVNSGGTLNLGNGSSGTVGFTAIGGGFGSSGTAGQGTLSINNGGVVNIAAGGTGASSLDGNRFWLNPYLAGGSATINLNSGGLLSTARPISNGSSSTATFVFDGGTLRATDAVTLLIASTTSLAARIAAGGAIIDTNGFDASITVPLTDDTGATGSLTKQGAGTLTLTGANTFTGDVTVSAGTIRIDRAANSATPTATALGNMNVARTITIQAGGTLTTAQNDPLGNGLSSQPVTFVVDGGTLSHGDNFVTIGAIELRNGGLLTGGNGVNASYQSFSFNGDITVSGNAPASLTTTGTTNTGSHLNRAGGVTFDVADVTGDGSVDFTVATSLLDRAPNVGGAGSLTKTGAGTMMLSSANVYTGQTLVTGGMLEVAAGGSVIGTNRVNALDGGELVIDGTLTVGNNGSFGIGTGETSAGTVTVNSGGTLNLGNGSSGTVGFTAIGGGFGSSGTAGQGTLSINNGGVVNVAAGGTGASGLDGNRFWLNPYLAGGSATINLNSGGLLSTARPISNGGSGTRPASFFFDGGTLQAAGNTTLLMPQTNTITTRIKQGGAIIDTNGFDASITVPLTDDTGATGSLIKQGAGTLTLTEANTFTGTTTISTGTLALAATGSVANTATVSLASGSRLDLTSKTAGFSFGAGQTLAGTGLVTLGAGRDLTILGSLAPGQSPGTLALDGNLVLGSASTSLFEIDGVTSGLYDLIQESGGSHGVTFDGTLSLSFTSGWSSATTLKLFDFTTYSGSFSQVQATGLASGYTASFNELTGEVVVIPEPGLAAAGIAAAAALSLLAARLRKQIA